ESYKNADLLIMAEHLYRVATSHDSDDVRMAEAPRGIKIWEELYRTESRCNHSVLGMNTKYRKNFHNKLHTVDGLSGKKVLFLYHKYETELDSTARKIIACKYPGYDVTYRGGGIIDSYQRNARTDVDSDTEDGQETEVDIDNDEGVEVEQRVTGRKGRVKQELKVRGAKAKKEEESHGPDPPLPYPSRHDAAAGAAMKPEPATPKSNAPSTVRKQASKKTAPGTPRTPPAPATRKRKFADTDAAQQRQPPTAADVKPEPTSPASAAAATVIERPKMQPGVRGKEAAPEVRKRKLVDADAARKAVKTEVKTPAARSGEQRQGARGAATSDSTADAAGGWLESDAAASAEEEESGEQLKERFRQLQQLFVQQEEGRREDEVARELLRIMKVSATSRNIGIVTKAKDMAAGNFESENHAPVQYHDDDDDDGAKTKNVYESDAQSTAARVLAELETLNANGELINAMTRAVVRVKAKGEEEYE
ncbi:hypothetical protein PMAYCL1PPCAC_10206, partial [Pristionchus mayeri]